MSKIVMGIMRNVIGPDGELRSGHRYTVSYEDYCYYKTMWPESTYNLTVKPLAMAVRYVMREQRRGQ